MLLQPGAGGPCGQSATGGSNTWERQDQRLQKNVILPFLGI